MTASNPEQWRVPPDVEVHPAARAVRFDDILNRLERSLTQLDCWGIRVAPGSRLAEYVRTLRFALQQTEADQRFLERLSFAILDISEVTEIVESIGTPSERAFTRLSSMATGGYHPDDETTSPGRDAQYELWLCAFLAQRGIPAELADPDISIAWNGQTIPVEAKRPKSHDAVDVRFRKALKQLDAFPEGGVVALSLDLLLRPPGEVLFAESPADASRKMDHVFDEHCRRVLNPTASTRRAPGRNAVGLLFTAKIPAFVSRFGLFVFEFRCELFRLKGDQRGYRLAELRKRVSSRARVHNGNAS